MSSKQRVGILAKVFVEWSGGVDFIVYLTNALAANPKYDVYFFVPDSNDALHTYDYIAPNKIAKFVMARRNLQPLQRENPAHPQFDNLAKNVHVVYYRNSLPGFFSALFRHKIKLVLPTTETLGKDFPLPWIGYIWDFQHRHLPQYFSADEIKGRDVAFKSMLADTATMIVNSKQVKQDIQECFPALYKKCRVVALPFAPSPEPQWLNIDSSRTVKKYHIAEHYVIICNQFWLHKDHMTAIKAFAKVAKTNPNLQLVCTGKMEEPRDPGYIDRLKKTINTLGLADRVHLVGFIPKEDQIALIKAAGALLQPTLYEGGPGGGSTYNAVALGVPVVMSDIPVNREIKNNDVTFFTAGSANDLADKIVTVVSHTRKQPDRTKLKDKGADNFSLLSAALSEVVDFAIKKRGKT